MGMFDYVVVSCPKCGERVEDQTKAFGCVLETINLDEPLSPYVAGYFDGDEWKCENCNTTFKTLSGVTDKILLHKEQTK